MANGVRKKIKLLYGLEGAVLTVVFAMLVYIDLLLKCCAVEYDWHFTVIPGVIEVVHVTYNTGAAFSFLSGKAWAQTFFIVLTIIMLVAMVFGFLALPKKFTVMRVALVLVGGGAVGNLVDRIAFSCVRDFVDVWMFGTTACCNFADFFIVFGVILAVIDMLFLNDWAAFPLTKSAKAAQAKRREEADNADVTDNGD